MYGKITEANFLNGLADATQDSIKSNNEGTVISTVRTNKLSTLDVDLFQNLRIHLTNKVKLKHVRFRRCATSFASKFVHIKDCHSDR